MNTKQFKIIALMALFVMSVLVITPLGLTQSANAQPPNIIYQAPITIYNNQSVATSNPYQQLLQLNESIYNGYITYNGTVANFEFSYANNSIIPSWIESNNSGVLPIWLNLTSIAANSQLTIYADFASLSTNLLSNSGTTGIGEAPQLSPTYAEYDDGQYVFPIYYNFAGTTLDSRISTASESGNYILTQDNGLTIQINTNSNMFYIMTSSFINSPFVLTAHDTFYPTSTSSGTTNEEWGLVIDSSTSISQDTNNAYGGTNYLGIINMEGGVSPQIMMGNVTLASGSLSYTSQYTYLDTITQNSTNVSVNFDGTSLSTANNSITSGYIGFYIHLGAGSIPMTIAVIKFLTVTSYPPNGVMPSVSYSNVQPQYTITFNESGLPSDSLWNVSINNNIYSTNTTSLNLSLFNGAYSYIAQTLNPDYSTIYGNITVNGANLTVNLTFIAPLYNIDFIESGLPFDTLWNSTLINSTYNYNFYNSTNTNSLNFTVPNGTYSYTILVNNYNIPTYGNVTVNGANITINISFPVYNVTFIESGLPSNTEWNIYLNASYANLIYESTNTSTISYILLNGNYTYLMTQNNSEIFLFDYYDNVDNLTVVQNGSFTVNNSSITIYLNFSLYSVDYNISNSNNYNYSITFSNSTYNITYQSNTSLIEYMPNGTYNDTIIPLSNPFAIISGYENPITVNGTDLIFNITFSGYNVEFNITGLGVNGLLTISVYNSNNNTLMFNSTSGLSTIYALLPNAQYYLNLTTSSIDFTASATPSTFTINNTLTIVNISIYYDVLTIQESGLAVNIAYTLNLTYTDNGTVISNISLNTQTASEYIWYGLPIGVNLTVVASSEYLANNYSLNVSFYFTGNYTYDFNFITNYNGNITLTVYETGLPLNTLWYFSLYLAPAQSILFNESSYNSFMIFSDIGAGGDFAYIAYSQGYSVITNPSYTVVNNTTITVNFITNSIVITNTTLPTSTFNFTNILNLNISVWKTIGFLGGSGVIMAVVGAFINPIGAFIVLGIEMIIGYELSIINAWILFIIGLAITTLIFYRRAIAMKKEE